MAEITFSGLASGLATDDIVTKLMAVERKPIDRLENEKEYEAQRLRAYGQLNDRLADLAKAASAMNLTSGARTTTAKLSSESTFTATSSGAATGSYDITVTQLAQVQKSISAGYASNSTSLFGTGSITIGTQQIAIDSTNNSLQGMMSAINAESDTTGVTASIINDGSGGITAYRMVLTGKDASTTFSVTSSLKDDLDADIAFAADITKSQDAKQALLTVDGIAVTSKSNTVTGVISGVTLNLTATSPVSSVGPPVVYTPTKMDIVADSTSLKEKISTFVTSYNSIMDWIAQGYQEEIAKDTTTDTTTETAEEEILSDYLRGDATVNSVKRGLQSVLTSVIDGSGSMKLLSNIGISTQKDGTLNLNNSKLDAALSEDFTGVTKLLAGDENNDGVMDKFNTYLLNVTAKASGMYAEKRERYTTKVERIDNQIELKTSLLEKTEATMKARFSAMELLVSNLNSMGSYLTQISNLGSNN